MFAHDDGWDWPWLFYIGRNWLGFTEDEFWETTPRTFKALLNVHMEIKKLERQSAGGAQEPQLTTIDQIKGW